MSNAVTETIDVRRLGSASTTTLLRERVERLLAHGLLEPPPGSLSIARAGTPEELRDAYALVHRTFVTQGYIDPMPRGVRVRVFELLPEMCTFVAKLDGKLVGVMSVVPDSPDLGLPSDATFHQELEMLRRPQRRLVEITNLALAEEVRNTSVFMELARCITAHVINQAWDDAFVAISPHHALFFENILRFEPWGKRRASSVARGDFVQGAHCDVRRFEAEIREIDRVLGERAFLHAWFFTDNPYFAMTKHSAMFAKRRALREDTLRVLLGVPDDLLQRFSAREITAVGEHWREAG